jgi:hypothetical protein
MLVNNWRCALSELRKIPDSQLLELDSAGDRLAAVKVKDLLFALRSRVS